MDSLLYDFLINMGYHHPLHPALTHLPVGLTIASFIFMALSPLLRQPDFSQTAKHCVVLAFLAAIPTVVVGYLDWQYYYGGSFIFPIKMKLALACMLLILLALIWIKSKKTEEGILSRLVLHGLSFFIVAGIGFYGGELVYGKKSTRSQTVTRSESQTESVSAGAEIFRAQCSSCHFTDNTDTKFGPGLKGVFQLEKMPVSGWPVSAENVRRQLFSPYSQMPRFDQFTDEEITALTDYLKSL
jgi:uncharacterized membrane protein